MRGFSEAASGSDDDDGSDGNVFEDFDNSFRSSPPHSEEASGGTACWWCAWFSAFYAAPTRAIPPSRLQ